MRLLDRLNKLVDKNIQIKDESIFETQTEAVLDSSITDRGKGPGEISLNPINPSSLDSNGFIPQKSPYYDKSLEYLRILEIIDTYMLGESETNFPLLVDKVLNNKDWKDTAGLAYLEKGELVLTNPPEKIQNIDSIPFMSRDILSEYKIKYKSEIPASILASRGCFYRCSFCSVVQYEKIQIGPNHRVRSNINIIDEIKFLNYNYNITYFNFEDDNFIMKGKRGIEKLINLCDLICSLPFKIKFTFFCRADSVNYELFNHLKNAGAVGIYFGMESVHGSDLAFFHKDLKTEDNFNALDILYQLGYSCEVEAEFRILLGYITWHPLTSFESLKETSEFIRKYKCPPKLLRRKLRIYSQTESLNDVMKLGLINSINNKGWDFNDKSMIGLDDAIDNFFSKINNVRDKLRTLEKAFKNFKYQMVDILLIKKFRTQIDNNLYAFFDDVIEIVQQDTAGIKSKRAQEYMKNKELEFEDFVKEFSISTIIKENFEKCNLNMSVTDLFRK